MIEHLAERWRGTGIRGRQLGILLVLAVVFILLGGPTAADRFTRRMLGEYYLLQGEAEPTTTAGLAALSRAAAQQPEWAAPHLAMAEAYYAQGWFVGAIHEATRAFELAGTAGEQSQAAYIAGLAHLATGARVAARDRLRLAIERDPTNARARARLDQLSTSQ